MAATGLVTTGLIYWPILRLQAQGRSAAALNMPDMGMADIAKFWAFPVLQASGLAGLIFAYLSMVLGLLQAGRPVRWLPLGYRDLDRLHRQVSGLVIGLVLVHVTATVFDAMGNDWVTVLVPGAVGWQGWPAAVWGFDAGIFATYTLLLVAPTFYLRRSVGIRRWRFVHRFVLVFYVLSVWHTLVLGLDVAYYPVLRPVIWLCQIPLLAMLIRRVATPLRSDASRSAAGRSAAGRSAAARRVGGFFRYLVVNTCAAAIVAILFIVATGHAGFIQTV